MEENNSSVIGTLTLLISDVALLDAVYTVFSIKSNNETLSIGVLQWLVLAIVSLTLYRLFILRERTMLQAFLFLSISYAITVAALLVFFVKLPSFLSTAIALIFWSLPFFRIFSATKTPPKLEKLTARFEGVVIVLLLLLLFIIGTDRSLSIAIPCAASLLLCFVSLIVMRTDRSSAGEGAGKRGAAAVLAFFLLIGSTTAVFLLYAFASFGDTVAEGAAAILRGIRALFDLLTRFLSWLVSLLPAPEYDGDFAGEAVSMQGEAAVTGEPVIGGRIILIIIVCAIAVLLVSFVIATVIKYRRDTFGGKRKLKASGIKRRGKRLRTSLFRRFSESLRFLCSSVLYRNTPQGMFVLLERWGRRRRCGRAPGETQRNYLARLSAILPGSKHALLCLADALDARWYGDPRLSQLPRRELIQLRKSFSVVHQKRRHI